MLATGVVAAAGLAGLCMRRMPAKGRLTLILFVGVAGLWLVPDRRMERALAWRQRTAAPESGDPPPGA